MHSKDAIQTVSLIYKGGKLLKLASKNIQTNFVGQEEQIVTEWRIHILVLVYIR